MLQRIQTVYLFIALVLVLLCFFIPVANVYAEGKLYVFNINGFKALGDGVQAEYSRPWPLLISGMLLCCILFITIITYKNRMMQIRLCVYAIIFSFTMVFMFFWILNNTKNNFSADVKYLLPFIFPVIAGVLSFLAILAIRKDENKVRSYDRLR